MKPSAGMRFIASCFIQRKTGPLFTVEVGGVHLFHRMDDEDIGQIFDTKNDMGVGRQRLIIL